MSASKTFLQSGHAPTLFAAFLYFAFSCAIWVLNGAMAPFIKEAYQLSAAQMGLMLSIPIIGALGGGLVPGTMGLAKQYLGAYGWGFFLFAALAFLVLVVMRLMQARWTRTWAERGGRARVQPAMATP